MNSKWPVKLCLFGNYFLFAILLNSVGTAILQVQNSYAVSASEASILEAFKDLSIAITSFLTASLMVRLGYKRAMLIALLLITCICLLAAQVSGFWIMKLLFAAVGIGFALIKVATFACIALLTNNQREHASFMNFLEAFFMIGVLSGFFLFSLFVDDLQPGSRSWLQVYYLLAIFGGMAFIALLMVRLDETEIQVQEDQRGSVLQEFVAMFKLSAQPLVFTFVISAFLYVLIEQSIMSWLPSFNSSVLNMSTSLSIQMASILAASTAIGRLVAGFLLKKIDWFILVFGCLLISAVLVLLAMPLAEKVSDGVVSSWAEAPVAAYVFPLIGLCLAPVYPAINSSILSALPARQHGAMAGLIVVFSALGGTTGSIITGHLFEVLGGQSAFYFSLLPIALIVFCLFLFKRQLSRNVCSAAT